MLDRFATNIRRLYAGRHPWAQAALQAAALTGQPGEWYLDQGQWCVIAYLMTGDSTYAAKAWAKIQPVITQDPSSANYIRENGWELALWYGWLAPALSDADRATYAAGLNRWCQWSCGVNTKQYAGGFRLSPVADSDQTIGQYMTLALTDLLTGTSWLQATAHDWAGHSFPVGGLGATAADRSTVRNTLAQFVTLAAGGQWPESSEYDGGTLKLLLLGAAAVNDLAGHDCFPEVTALIPQLARAARFDLTADLAQPLQWGDDEHPRDPWWWTRLPYLALLSGLCPGDYALADMVSVLAAKVPFSTYRGDLWRALYTYDPEAGRRSQQPGMGMLRYKTATALFHAHWQPSLLIDHEVAFLGDIQLYDQGEWVLTHPIGYGGLVPTGAGVNSLILAGLASIGPGWQRSVKYSSGVGWCALTGTAGGPYYAQPYYQPPTDFLHSWTRSIIYLDPGVVVIRDVVDVSDPRQLAGLNRYKVSDLAAIQQMPALAQWVLHAPVQPTLTASGLSWLTASGRPVTVQVLSPTPPLRINLLDESQLLTVGAVTSERHWQARILSDSPQTTFLAVLSVGPAPAVSLNADGSLAVGGRTITFAADGTPGVA